MCAHVELRCVFADSQLICVCVCVCVWLVCRSPYLCTGTAEDCTASAARPGLPSCTRATPWSWTALCSKRNKVAIPFHSNHMERRRHDAPCAGVRTFAIEPHRTARPARRARARRLPRPNLGSLRIMHAKTSAPPQRSERAGTVGGIRLRQVPWMIAARSWSRRLLGLAGPGLTPPCPCHTTVPSQHAQRHVVWPGKCQIQRGASAERGG
jgi:hypothetical protein